MPLRDDERNGQKARRVMWRLKDIMRISILERELESASGNNENILIELCALKIKTGNATDVLKLLSTAKNDLSVLEMKAIANIECGNYEGGQKCAMDAFKLKAGSPSASVSLAVCRSMEWDVGSAMDYFEIAESVAPDYGRLYIERGLHYLRTGMNLEAVADFQKACELMADEAEPVIELVESYISSGANDDAIQLLEKKVLEIDDSAGIYYLQAQLYKNCGKIDAAKDVINSALTIHSDMTEYLKFKDSVSEL